MATLQESAQSILNEKNSKVLPENIVAGVTMFGVEGTASNLDTSDATATADDLAIGQTAYVNGEKIEGTVQTYYAADFDTEAIWSTTLEDGTTPAIGVALTELETPIAFQRDGSMGLRISEANVANFAGLTADKIVTGNTILGIEGIAELEGVKIFKTVEELQADTDAKLGDTALIYNEETQELGSYYVCTTEPIDPDGMVKSCLTGATTYDTEVRTNHDITNLPELLNALDYQPIFVGFYDVSADKYIAHQFNYSTFIYVTANGEKYLATCCPDDDDIARLYVEVAADKTTIISSGEYTAAEKFTKLTDSGMYGLPSYAIAQIEEEDIIFGTQGSVGGSGLRDVVELYDETAQSYKMFTTYKDPEATLPYEILAESLDTSDATATTNDILKGTTAYVNGEKIEGTYEPVVTSEEFSEIEAIASNILGEI